MTARQDLQIRQGQTWEFVYTHPSPTAPDDLTGYTARMSIRSNYAAGYEAHLSTESDADGGSIALGGAAGTVTLSMTAAQTAALGGNLTSFILTDAKTQAEPVLTFIYDLELVSGATVTRALEGRVIVFREVTT